MKLENIIQNKYYSSIMLFNILAYAFIDIQFHRVGSIFLAFIIIGTIPILIFHRKKILRNYIFIIFILILLLEVASWINSLIYLSEYAHDTPRLDRLGKLFIFFFISYWLQGSKNNVIALWSAFALGFLFTVITNIDINTLINFSTTLHRANFQIKNSQWDSMLSATSLIVSFFIFYITSKSSTNIKIKIPLLLTISIFILIFSYFVLITQSRQVWLALIAVVFMGPIIYIAIQKTINIKIIIFISIVIVGLFFILSNSKIIQKRVSTDQKTISKILKDNKDIEMSSIGIRVNSWLEAKEWIIRHPFIGLDSSAIAEVIQQSKIFNENMKKQFGHLHNFFIETLVAFGILGLLLIISVYYLVIKSIWHSSLPEGRKKEYVFFAIIFTLFWFIINNFESFNSRTIGIFTHNIILASFYTFYFTNSLKEKENENENN